MWLLRKGKRATIASAPHIINAIPILIQNLEKAISKIDSQLKVESNHTTGTLVSTEAMSLHEDESEIPSNKDPPVNEDAGINCLYFNKTALVKVLVVASHAHLYLKLRHSTGANVPLIRYLGLVEDGFSSVCLNLYSKIENCDRPMAIFYLTEIQNTFHYLLHRLQELNIK